MATARLPMMDLALALLLLQMSALYFLFRFRLFLNGGIRPRNQGKLPILASPTNRLGVLIKTEGSYGIQISYTRDQAVPWQGHMLFYLGQNYLRR